MVDNSKKRNAQSFGRKLVKILGERHLQLREAKFVSLIFFVVLSIIIFIAFDKSRSLNVFKIFKDFKV